MEQKTFSQKLKLRSIVAAVYILSLLAVGAIGFYPVIFLAGPHSNILPDPLESSVLWLYIFALVFLPILVAGKVRKKLSKKVVETKESSDKPAR